MNNTTQRRHFSLLILMALVTGLIPLIVVAKSSVNSKSAKNSSTKNHAVFYTKGYSRGLQSMFKPGEPYKVYTRKDEMAQLRAEGMLTFQQREDLFRKAGLGSSVAKMDEFERDVLVNSAGALSLKELKKDFPKLPEAGLKKLQSAVRKRK